MEATCKTCGRTDWLLLKEEKRFYYSQVREDSMTWIELTKKKHVSPYRLICAKCEEEADKVASNTYMIRTKPLKVVWQYSWDILTKGDE